MGTHNFNIKNFIIWLPSQFGGDARQFGALRSPDVSSGD